MNTKAKGSRKERAAKTILEAAGYLVTKSGASLGVFDLIALGPQAVRCVQVKSNRPPPPSECEKIMNLRGRLPANATLEIWVFYDGNTTPRIEYL